MHCHRVRETITCSHTNPAKEEGLNELRNTLQQATSCMERSSENVHLLGERMAAATERISESMQENSQALAMLTHVVEKLQELVSTNNTTSESPHCTETASRVVNRMGSRSLSVPTSPAIASSSRFSHCPSCSSSSSSSSSAITLLEQSVLSKGKSFDPKTKPLQSSQRRQVDVQHRMTNGSLTSSPAQNHKVNSSAFRCFFSQKKKKSKKKE
ncbi:MAGUK p55 subfamily member 4 isoform X4 [Labeo rohita]|uniref:MAGUK p55 subfamily member 4 isoform X4 n=2 Tax=Labeo rohita TaxID=84645 RepID=A0A498NPP9_LABRO|nr:MAGUK p55 subfamily member 4 isoform X4 [Labeo rohita]